MHRREAVSIVRQLQEASLSLNDALRIAIRHTQDRQLRHQIAELDGALHLKILPQIYDEHPDLRPPPKKPRISSKLSWDKVKLPPEISAKDIDDALFPLLSRNWQKVARVLGNAGDHFKPLGVSLEIVGARLRHLADTNRIEGAGDLRKWGHSEVRLKQK